LRRVYPIPTKVFMAANWRTSAFTTAVAVAVASCVLVSAKWVDFGSLGRVLHGWMGNNIVFQTIFGSTLAGSTVVFSQWLCGWIKSWLQSILFTKMTVVDGLVVDAVQRWLTTSVAPDSANSVLAAIKSPNVVVSVLSRKARLRAAMSCFDGVQPFPAASSAVTDIKLECLPNVLGLGNGSRGGGVFGSGGSTGNPLADIPIPVRHNGKTIFVSIVGGQTNKSVTLWIRGRGQHCFLLDFLQEVVDKDQVLSAQQAKQSIGLPDSRAVLYVATFAKQDSSVQASWTAKQEVQERQRDTVFLPEGVMASLLADGRNFFKGYEEYEAQQRPFRRGWLLHGPPGTGKSTMGMVVARELNMPLCILHLGDPSLTDEHLRNLLSTAPVPSIIMFEDVDACCGSTLARGPLTKASKGRIPESTVIGDDRKELPSEALFHQMHTAKKETVTLAGILNSLDSGCAHEGHLIIMTTNHMDKLDSALIRPGRCDRCVHLPLADETQIRQMIYFRFPDITENDMLHLQACIVPKAWSPAHIMGYLCDSSTIAAAVNKDRLRKEFETAMGATIQKARPFYDMYNHLWKMGLEDVFGDALACGSSLENFRDSMYSRIDPTLNPFKYGSESYKQIDYDEAAVTLAEYSRLFMHYFPDANELGARFATEMIQFGKEKHIFPSITRCIVHLNANNDDPELAMSSMYDWFLRYERVPGAHIAKPVSIEFLLFIRGYVGERNAAAIEEAKREGVTAHQIIAQSERLRLGKSLEAYDEVAVSAFMVKHSMLTYGCAQNRYMLMHRSELGEALANVYCCDVKTAMHAARQITRPNGRSGYSTAAFYGLLESVDTLPAALDALKAAQGLYKFPDVFRNIF
jgi:hypothetical protein